MRDILWIVINVLCVIYTVSYAVFEIKEKRVLSGVFSVVLSVCAVFLSVLRVFL